MEQQVCVFSHAHNMIESMDPHFWIL